MTLIQFYEGIDFPPFTTTTRMAGNRYKSKYTIFESLNNFITHGNDHFTKTEYKGRWKTQKIPIHIKLEKELTSRDQRKHKDMKHANAIIAKSHR